MNRSWAPQQSPKQRIGDLLRNNPVPALAMRRGDTCRNFHRVDRGRPGVFRFHR
jgi:hypothetical protein